MISNHVPFPNSLLFERALSCEVVRKGFFVYIIAKTNKIVAARQNRQSYMLGRFGVSVFTLRLRARILSGGEGVTLVTIWRLCFCK